MPIVDGLTSTKMIRSYEKLHLESNLSPRAAGNGRVPIFAVSASLLERERQNYINAGFDGWILKPIDFKRLNTLLLGIVEDDKRNSCLYKPGEWERGGWFNRKQSSVFSAATTPAEKNPSQRLDDNRDKSSNYGSSESGSVTPTETKRPLIHDERLDIPRTIDESYFPVGAAVLGKKNSTEKGEMAKHEAVESPACS